MFLPDFFYFMRKHCLSIYIDTFRFLCDILRITPVKNKKLYTHPLEEDPMFFFMVRRLLFYFKLLWISVYRAHKDKTAPLTLRRIIVLVSLNLGITVVMTLNWICLLLDEILFPDFKKVELKKPIFTLGVPRSGSTLFLRLVAQDQKNFATTKFWEIIFAPSILQRKFFGILGKIDAKLGGLLTWPIKKIDKKLFASSKKIHQVGLYLYEEDAIMLIWAISTFFVFFAYPYMDQFEDYLHFDDKMPEKDKKYIMRFYKKCMQRHLYYHGPHKRLLSKNPTFAPWVRTLQEHFPDAIFINTVRTPYQQIPSIYSFMVYFIGQFGGDFLKVPNFKSVVLEVIKNFYLNPVNTLKTMDEDKYMFMMFDDMVKDLDGSIRGLYKKFDLEMSPEFEKILHAKVEASKNYKSGHQYTMEQFGLTPELILEHYKEIFEEFDFDQEFKG